MRSSLQKLHLEFSNALKEHSYIAISEDKKTLHCTKEKKTALSEIFKFSKEKIEETLKSSEPLSLHDITHLTHLKSEGDLMYERYKNSINTWSRFILKNLAFYTPEFLRKKLPSCFSNHIAEAEAETKTAYTAYSQFLEIKLKSSSKRLQALTEEIFDPNDDVVTKPTTSYKFDWGKNSSTRNSRVDDSFNSFKKKRNDEEDRLLQAAIEASLLESSSPKRSESKVKVRPEKPKEEKSSSLEIKEKKLEKTKEPSSEKLPKGDWLFIKKAIDKINEFPTKPLNFQQLISLIRSANQAMLSSASISASEEYLLNTLKLDKEIISQLKNPELTAAIFTNNHTKILDLFSLTPWKTYLEEAHNQKGYIQFGIQKFGPSSIIKLKNNEGKDVKEKDLQNYRGEIHLNLSDVNTLGSLEELVSFLNKYSSCSPTTLKISIIENSALNSKIVKCLLQLNKRISHIEISNIKTISFKDMELTNEEKDEFINSLDSIFFPQIEEIQLLDSKDDFTPSELSALLNLFPSFPFLKECFQKSTKFSLISIPIKLTLNNTLDCSGLSFDQISHIISNYPSIKDLNLEKCEINDKELIQLIAHSNLLHLVRLNLSECKYLTLDIIPALSKMEHLTSLTLPDLPKGKIPCEELPAFDNPFKIKLFYTPSKVTQPLASKLYTGPHLWSAVFQIPLARSNVKNIFPNTQKFLTPKTIACWLVNNDYKCLEKEEGILTLFADNINELNDSNVAEFCKKFPKLKTISLFENRHITISGIIELINQCPSIENVDLTGCKNIQYEALNKTENIETLKKLKKLILSGTSLSMTECETLTGTGLKIDYLETTLSFKNEDFNDEDSLENLLKNRNLSKCKRLSFQGCKHLTNKMLSKVLDRFNAPILIEKEGVLVDNPQRLNAAVLNIQGCNQIDDTAFHQHTGSEKIDVKLLENLDRIIIEGTHITPLLQEIYPKITFQNEEQPKIIRTDADLVIKQCLDYQKKKEHPDQYIFNRMIVELFYSDQSIAQSIIRQSFDPKNTEFSDLSLSFLTSAEAKPEIFHIHRELVYCQSLYFLSGLRPGGNIHKVNDIAFVNVHAKPLVAKTLIDLLYGKLNITQLKWKVAADLAELIGPKNFRFINTLYKNLIKHIHNQFTLVNADQLLLIAKELGDDEGLQQYENILLIELKNLKETDQKKFIEIGNLAKSHGLKLLTKEVTKKERIMTNQLITKLSKKSKSIFDIFDQ